MFIMWTKPIILLLAGLFLFGQIVLFGLVSFNIITEYHVVYITLGFINMLFIVVALVVAILQAKSIVNWQIPDRVRFIEHTLTIWIALIASGLLALPLFLSFIWHFDAYDLVNAIQNECAYLFNILFWGFVRLTWKNKHNEETRRSKNLNKILLSFIFAMQIIYSTEVFIINQISASNPNNKEDKWKSVTDMIEEVLLFEIIHLAIEAINYYLEQDGENQLRGTIKGAYRFKNSFRIPLAMAVIIFFWSEILSFPLRSFVEESNSVLQPIQCITNTVCCLFVVVLFCGSKCYNFINPIERPVRTNLTQILIMTVLWTLLATNFGYAFEENPWKFAQLAINLCGYTFIFVFWSLIHESKFTWLNSRFLVFCFCSQFLFTLVIFGINGYFNIFKNTPNNEYYANVSENILLFEMLHLAIEAILHSVLHLSHVHSN